MGKVKNNLVYPEEALMPQLLSEQLTMDHLMKISYCDDILKEWSLVTVTIAVEHPA
ncbi:hypothetical protein J2Y45_006829 [Dyadobacter sp. BE34]|uniref:Uncharacterized protein n=1 Tax=Dyadobacter fermentans TaxID=94254 RepID=A0ABU1R8S9_9BACT|nr:hypothetical protein [Dyadobacter fermentans]MDR7047495.1 hypothetical protein [Dyadobacter sp. BE242]MDR7201665.1 hypothetical protein [Dyadobacter sp. BE34]MDR7219535.1 hypothetical protein [Dyadobacter sp. BE31]MDR7267342.1 hypothetical protein [Dyadobacter sp. BE32]